jgi:hypothetical protein
MLPVSLECPFLIHIYRCCIVICNNIYHTKTTDVSLSAREGKAVPVSYKTPVVLLTYTVKSGKSLVRDRGNITAT